MTWTCDQDQLLQSAGRAAHAQSRWRSSGRSVGAWWRGTVAARIWPLFANQQTYERRRRIALFLFLAGARRWGDKVRRVFTQSRKENPILLFAALRLCAKHL